MKTRCLILGLCVVACRVHAIEIKFTEIERKADGIALTWTAEAGKSYRVESSSAITGPWQNRIELTAATASLSWSDTENTGAGQRFHRVSNVIAALLSSDTFLAADSVSLVESTLARIFHTPIGKWSFSK